MQARPFSRPRPAGSFELYAWLFTRISAVVLLGMALFHLLYMHLGLGVEAISWQLIAWRWRSPVWRAFDILLLAFALLHGANGLRIVLDDYIRSKPWRRAARLLLLLLTGALLVMGALVVLTFRSP